MDDPNEPACEGAHGTRVHCRRPAPQLESLIAICTFKCLVTVSTLATARLLFDTLSCLIKTTERDTRGLLLGFKGEDPKFNVILSTARYGGVGYRGIIGPASSIERQIDRWGLPFLGCPWVSTMSWGITMSSIHAKTATCFLAISFAENLARQCQHIRTGNSCSNLFCSNPFFPVRICWLVWLSSQANEIAKNKFRFWFSVDNTLWFNFSSR